MDAFRHNAEASTVNSSDDGDSQDSLRCYDLPLVMPFIRRVEWFRFVPICPTFSRKKRGVEVNTERVNGNQVASTELADGVEAVRYRNNNVSL